MLIKILGGVLGWSIIWAVDYYLTMRERKQYLAEIEEVRLYYRDQLARLKKTTTKY